MREHSFEVELNGTRSRVRLLNGALDEAERRTLLLLLEATLASGMNRAELSQTEVLAAGGPPLSYEVLGKLAAVTLEFTRPSGSCGFLPLFETLAVDAETSRFAAPFAGFSEALETGLREALRQGAW